MICGNEKKNRSRNSTRWPNGGEGTRRLQPFRHLHDCSACFRLERWPGVTCTQWKSAALPRRTPEADIRAENRKGGVLVTPALNVPEAIISGHVAAMSGLQVKPDIGVPMSGIRVFERPAKFSNSASSSGHGGQVGASVFHRRSFRFC